MARVQLYQPGAIQREGTTAAKLQAVDYGPAPLGEGLQRAGAAVSDLVEKRDQIEALRDTQDAQALDLEHVEQARLLSQQLRQARGVGAREEATRLESELETFNRDILSRARSPRARLALQESISRRSAGEIDRYHAYADQEFVTEYRATSDARITTLTETARDIDDETEAMEAFTQVEGAIADRARFENWEGGATGPIAQTARLRQSTDFYIGRAQAIARSGDPQRAIDYAQAHEAEIAGDQLDAFVNGLTEEAREQRMEQRFLSGDTPATPPGAPSQPNEGRSAPINEGDQPGRFNVSGFTIGDGYGARRSGGGIHRGMDAFAPSGTPWRLGRDFEIIESHRQARVRSGRDGGNIARVRIGETEWLAMHLPDLPRAGRYRAGSAVLRSGDSGSASSSSPHIHWQPANAAAQRVYNQGRQATAAFLAGQGGQVASGGESSPSPASDLETRIAAIRADPELSYRDRLAAERVVRRRHGEQMAARDAREEEAARGVDEWMVNNGDEFTSVSQIPGFGNLSPSRRAALAERARRNREGDGRAITPDLILDYNFTQYSDPRRFASREYLRHLVQQGAPQALQRQWAADAGRIAGTSANQQAQNVTDARIWSIAEPIMREIGLDFDRVNRTDGAREARGRELSEAERLSDVRRKNQMLQRLRELSGIWTRANPGQVPDDALIRGWVGNMLASGSTNAEGQRVYNFEYDDQTQYRRMSPGDRQAAENALRAAGVPVTPENVVRFFRRRVALRSQRRP